MAMSLKENQGMFLDNTRRKAFNDLNEMIYDRKLKLQRNDQCFCGKSSFLKISRLDRYGLPFGTQICRDCGLISQTLSLTEDSLPVFYDQIYWPLNHGDAKNAYATDIGADEFCNFIVPEIRKRFNDKIKIVEIGCGQGERLSRLKKELTNNYDVTVFGCDYSQEAIHAAKKNNIIVKRGGIETFENEAPADVIILSHVFEHVVNLKKFLGQISNLSHERSLIYIEVPGVIDLKNKNEYNYNYQDYCVVAHIHNFSLSTLINVFSSANFIPIKGTEFVRLIVSKTGLGDVSVSNKPYSEIIDSLKEAEIYYLNWFKMYNNPIRKYFTSLFRSLIGRN
jgi:SAM-dependent methyltransferase